MTQIGLSKERYFLQLSYYQYSDQRGISVLWGALVASLFFYPILLFASLWCYIFGNRMRKKQALIALAEEKRNIVISH
jgi:hypothetical protein